MGWQTGGRWALWLLSLGLLCVLALWRVDPAGLVETNVLALLPEQATDPALEEARQRSRAAFSQQLLVLMRGTDGDRTRHAAQAAHAALRAAGMHDAAGGATVDAALALYRRHGYALLSPAAAARYRQQGAAALAQDVAVSLASPVGMVHLGDDPGGHVARFVAQLPRPYPDFVADAGMLSAQRGDQHLHLLRMQVPEAAFAMHGSEQAAQAVARARAAFLAGCPSCSFDATGAALFAAAARHQAHRETLILSTTSTLLIMLLIAWAYRSLAPHLLGFLQLGASIVAAGAAVIAVFGSIHILTLVFGTTLLGIAIDYAFVYFSEYWFGTTGPAEVPRKVRPGLLVGLLTAVLAFAFLGLTGFPALLQMAVFSVAGLVEAALVVLLLFPTVLRRPPAVAAHALLAWPARFLERTTRPSRWRWLLPLVALAAAAPGWWLLEASDDVRELSSFPPALLAADAEVRGALGRFAAPGFFLIEGADLDQALQREAALFGELQARLEQATLFGLSRFVPPAAEQQASLDAWAGVFGQPEALRQAFAATGLPPALATHLAARWQAAARAPLPAAGLLQAVPELDRFVIREPGGVALMASVFDNTGRLGAALRTVAEGRSGVRFVEPLAEIDAALGGIRLRATSLVVLGYLLISALMVWRYRWREAARMLYPPLLALALTLGVLGWLGVPLNVFGVVALILILGLGRDYAVFLREVGARQASTALAVLLSALTTLIGFGLLSFSEIPALHAFGLATGIGILASWLVTPLSLPPHATTELPS